MHDIDSYKVIYKNDNCICINDILDVKLANNVYKLISNKIFNKLWYLTINNGDTTYILPYMHRKNINHILDKLKINKKKGIFTYYKYRTFNIPQNMYIKQVYDKIISAKFINEIKEITGENITTLKEIFISKYEKNCYLDIHDGENKGKIAFIINVTKNWKIDDGGILYFLNEGNNIKKSFVPIFNSILIFKASDKLKQFVSSVNSFTKDKIYFITGWFT